MGRHNAKIDPKKVNKKPNPKNSKNKINKSPPKVSSISPRKPIHEPSLDAGNYLNSTVTAEPDEEGEWSDAEASTKQGSFSQNGRCRGRKLVMWHSEFQLLFNISYDI